MQRDIPRRPTRRTRSEGSLLVAPNTSVLAVGATPGTQLPEDSLAVPAVLRMVAMALRPVPKSTRARSLAVPAAAAVVAEVGPSFLLYPLSKHSSPLVETATTAVATEKLPAALQLAVPRKRVETTPLHGLSVSVQARGPRVAPPVPMVQRRFPCLLSSTSRKLTYAHRSNRTGPVCAHQRPSAVAPMIPQLGDTESARGRTTSSISGLIGGFKL